MCEQVRRHPVTSWYVTSVALSTLFAWLLEVKVR